MSILNTLHEHIKTLLQTREEFTFKFAENQTSIQTYYNYSLKEYFTLFIEPLGLEINENDLTKRSELLFINKSFTIEPYGSKYQIRYNTGMMKETLFFCLTITKIN
jgi:hypothetical protein